MPAHRIVMAVTPDMPIFEAAVPCTVFAVDRSDLVNPWYEFEIAGIGAGPLPLTDGFHFRAALRPVDVASADTLIVPACLNVHEAPPPALVELVRDAHARGTRILSICSGAFVLAAAGILDGRRATARRWRPSWPGASSCRRTGTATRPSTSGRTRPATTGSGRCSTGPPSSCTAR